MKLPIFRFLILVIFCSPAFGQALFPELNLNPDNIKKAQAMESEAMAQNDSVLLGKAWFLFGNTYKSAGNFSRGNEYFLKVIRILKGKDSKELAMAYLTLNEGIHVNGRSRVDYENACMALDIFSRMEDNSGIALAYNYITSFYKRIWIWDKQELKKTAAIPERNDTIRHCIDAIAFHASVAKDTTMMAEAHLQLADLYRHYNDKRAITELDDAYLLFLAKGDNNAVVHTLCHMASAFLKFGDMPNAIKSVDKAEKLMSQKQIADYWTSTHLIEAQVDVFVGAKLWKRAFEAASTLNHLYAQRRSGDRDNAIQSFYLKEEAEKKEAEIQAQRAELEAARAERNFTLAMGALLLLAIITSLVFYFLYKKNRQISAKNQDLVREQNHRVKNNLQVIASLLSLQSDQLDDTPARRMIDETLLRIESMAILHRRLYDGEQLAQVDLADFIPEIVRGVLETLGVKQVSLDYQLASVLLGADKATPVGLIVNELTTNACKYAFGRTPNPRFRIECFEHNRVIRLVVTDNGPGMEGVNLSVPLKSLLKSHSSTFGIALIQSQILQLNGKGQFTGATPPETGVTFQLEFARAWPAPGSLVTSAVSFSKS